MPRAMMPEAKTMIDDGQPPIATMHLYRGAPAVRAWSRYQETDQGWTLCGVRRIARCSHKRRAGATEDAGRVNNCLTAES